MSTNLDLLVRFVKKDTRGYYVRYEKHVLRAPKDSKAIKSVNVYVRSTETGYVVSPVRDVRQEEVWVADPPAVRHAVAQSTQ